MANQIALIAPNNNAVAILSPDWQRVHQIDQEPTRWVSTTIFIHTNPVASIVPIDDEKGALAELAIRRKHTYCLKLLLCLFENNLSHELRCQAADELNELLDDSSRTYALDILLTRPLPDSIDPNAAIAASIHAPRSNALVQTVLDCQDLVRIVWQEWLQLCDEPVFLDCHPEDFLGSLIDIGAFRLLATEGKTISGRKYIRRRLMPNDQLCARSSHAPQFIENWFDRIDLSIRRQDPKASLELKLRKLTNYLEQLCTELAPDAAPNDKTILAVLSRQIDATLTVCSALEEELVDDTAALRKSQELFRNAIEPWFSQSWFMKHALTKPRGYAGDYLMMEALYDHLPKSTGVGGYLDLYFLNTELGTAVPNRLSMARDFLANEAARRVEMSVLNIASGAGREYQNSWKLPDDCRMHVYCIDLDDEALERIHHAVCPNLPFNIELECVRYNVLKTGNSTANREAFGQPDVIYSIGLCDYIPDRLLIRILSGWRETIADGGVVYVAFKDCLMYDKTKYQWLVDWYFHQRTPEECRDLFRLACYDMDTLEMIRDETGSIINFIGRKQQSNSQSEKGSRDDLLMINRLPFSRTP